MTRLTTSFYLDADVVAISRRLLGKVLCTSIGEKLTKAIIVETEAYAGADDRASHAHGGRRTKRTEPMYAAGGIAYVYLCYGIHHLFNVVTGARDSPHAVLIRAGYPLLGADVMSGRRRKSANDKSLLAGPGSLSRALGIRTDMTGTSLQGGRIWIEDHDIEFDAASIQVTPRIGVDYAAEDALRPYRFLVDTARVYDLAGQARDA
jgi:DNA-3-methyladenine glycosylase